MCLCVSCGADGSGQADQGRPARSASHHGEVHVDVSSHFGVQLDESRDTGGAQSLS